jgi:hypothetical protein
MSEADDRESAAEQEPKDKASLVKSLGEVSKVKKKRKAARVQVDPSSVNEHERPPQTGSIFNIWYLKW